MSLYNLYKHHCSITVMRILILIIISIIYKHLPLSDQYNVTGITTVTILTTFLARFSHLSRCLNSLVMRCLVMPS